MRLDVPAHVAESFRDTWPAIRDDPALRFPRSVWLGGVEATLATLHPSASRADLNLTARSLAPFPLAAGSNVP